MTYFAHDAALGGAPSTEAPGIHHRDASSRESTLSNKKKTLGDLSGLEGTTLRAADQCLDTGVHINV